MALVVEDGTFVSGANSYVTLAEADAFLADSLTRDEWSCLADDAKERLLIAASRWLDQQAAWNGTKADVDKTNDLRWPRAGVCDRDGLPVAEDEIPAQLKQAVFELALFFTNPDNNPTRFSDNQGIEEITVDVITLRFGEGYDQTARRFLPGINVLLQGLGNVSTSHGRQHARIVRS